MQQMHNLLEPPSKLESYLESALLAGAIGQLRRRAVLSWDGSNAWVLVGCTVEAFPETEMDGLKLSSRIYKNTILYEDWLTPRGCKEFINDVQRGEISIAENVIKRVKNPVWRTELVAADNDYMDRSGMVVATSFEERMAAGGVEPLVTIEHPYYPDMQTATGEWLAIKKYNGFNDGRRGEIMFVLPEAAAYFTSAEHDKGILEISVGGSLIHTMLLTVKGAYWSEDRLTHFGDTVISGKVAFSIPDDISRLEYVLINSAGIVLDFQREGLYRSASLRRKGKSGAARDFQNRVDRARSTGEGQKVEFKPFIRLEKGLGTKDKKTKLREVVMSAVAFANADGGQIFLGIEDDCDVTGINEGLQAWAEALANETSTERYRGALLASIKGNVTGEIQLQIEAGQYGHLFLIVISVARAVSWPILVLGDQRLFVRVGASNKQVAPNEWRAYQPTQALSGLD